MKVVKKRNIKKLKVKSVILYEEEKVRPYEDDCCPYYHNDFGKGECWGTKEREYCDCGGNKKKCNYKN